MTDEKLKEYFESELAKIIHELLVEIPKVQSLLQDEIDKIDRDLKRWRGFWGFFRFVWDDIRGRTK